VNLIYSILAAIVRVELFASCGLISVTAWNKCTLRNVLCFC